jgi:FdhE protein
MTASHDRRIARAIELAGTCPEAAPLLEFHCELTRFQKPIFEEFSKRGETDVRCLLRYFPDLFRLTKRAGPTALATTDSETSLLSRDREEAVGLSKFDYRRLEDPAAQEELLLSQWQGESDSGLADREPEAFFARVLLQPYAEYLATRGQIDLQRSDPSCSFCNARPVASVLRGEGDGGKRWLVCSLCSTEWPFRRLLCANCGETDREKLPVFTNNVFDYVRVEACDTCGAYLKSIDCTLNGHAIPAIDELATVSLTIWAESQGYSKVEPNGLGL